MKLLEKQKEQKILGKPQTAKSATIISTKKLPSVESKATQSPPKPIPLSNSNSPLKKKPAVAKGQGPGNQKDANAVKSKMLEINSVKIRLDKASNDINAARASLSISASTVQAKPSDVLKNDINNYDMKEHSATGKPKALAEKTATLQNGNKRLVTATAATTIAKVKTTGQTSAKGSDNSAKIQSNDTVEDASEVEPKVDATLAGLQMMEKRYTDYR